MSESLNFESAAPATPTPAATPTAPASGPGDVAQLKETCDSLAAQLQTTRIILLAALVGMALFFWREASFNGAIVAQLQPQVMQISQLVAQLEKQGSSLEKQGQALQNAALRLAEFGRTNPSYAQILAKYGIVVQQAAPAAAPANPAPAR
jgi:hypothetical protein